MLPRNVQEKHSQPWRLEMSEKELINILLRILEVVHGDRVTLDTIEDELREALAVEVKDE